MNSNLKVINVLSPENRKEYIESLYDIKFPLLSLMMKGEKTIARDMFESMVNHVKINKDKKVQEAIDDLFKNDLTKPANVNDFAGSDSLSTRSKIKSLNNGHFKPEKDIAA